MQIIIPMAWKWTRFKKQWYHCPKYLLSVNGKTILENIILNFDTIKDTFIFICNEQDKKNKTLLHLLSKLQIKYQLIVITEHSFGPVYSILQASEYINKKEKTIVNYCDFYWKWDYHSFQTKMNNYDGSIICYKWFHPHLLWNDLYAWVKLTPTNELIEIKEKYSYTKNKMDTYQSSGTYYFKNGKILIDSCKKMIENNITCKWEFYVSLLYNLLKQDAFNIYVYEIKNFIQLWTPKDYEEYKYWENIFRKN